MSRRVRRALSVLLVAVMLLAYTPSFAIADIHFFEDDFVASPTNPNKPDNYNSVWREGWGNDPVAEFDIKLPQPDVMQPAITGGFYYVNRPLSAPATIGPTLWGSSYYYPISNASIWHLPIDLYAESLQPGPLFDTGYVHSVIPSRTMEGPYATYVQVVAKDTTDGAKGAFWYGLDVTPPQKVTGLTLTPGAGYPAVGGVLTQSRGVLKWDDKLYDGLSGTGYFEAFLDSKPYDAPNDSEPGRRVYDLKEHYPNYGFSVPTKREMIIEDLPAGTHTLQIRAVDRATNPGPLSDPVAFTVDPDLPVIDITSPSLDGETMGGIANFAASVTDEGGVGGVGFYIDGVKIGTTQTVGPFEVTQNLSAYGDGTSHTLRVYAVDVGGRTNFASKQFKIDKKPTVQVVLPASGGEIFGELVPLKAQFTDKAAVTLITFRVDGIVVGTCSPSPDEASGGIATLMTRIAPGGHTVTASVANAVGGSATSTETITIDATRRPVLDRFAPNALTAAVPTKWYNSEFPEFPTTDTRSINDATEILYSVNRTPMTWIDAANPNSYYSSFDVRTGQTHFTGVIDQNGIYQSNTAGFTGIGTMPGAVRPIEGVWYAHARVRSAISGEVGPSISTAYGIDLTAPSQVTGLAVYSSVTAPSPAVGWLQQTRAHIRWPNVERDGLSGVDHYAVYRDGELIAEPPYELGRPTMGLTLEDLAPGPHEVIVTAVDRAGNESVASAPLMVRIYSTPEINITSPNAPNALLTSPAPLRALVNDSAGVASVRFDVDGAVVGTFTPSSLTTQMACSTYKSLATGVHTMTVTAISVSGPSTTASRPFSVDASLPPDITPPDPGPGDGGGSGEPSVTPTFLWFNTLFPTFTAKPSDVPTDPTEMLYLVDRTPVTPIDPAMPNLYYGFFNPINGSTYFNGLIDQNGVYLSNPSVFDGALQMPGRVTQPTEGIWYIHALIRNAEGVGSPVAHVGYGVDLTSPIQVPNVAAYKSVMATSPVNGWLNQNRIVLRWNGTERDLLSGTSYYRVYVDAKRLDDNQEIGFQRGRNTMSLTIEDLTEGVHGLVVTAVDLAGNESTKSATATVKIDLLNPFAKLLTPAAAGGKLGAKPALSALVTDTVGVSKAEFYVDTTKVGTWTRAVAVRSATATCSPDLNGFATGSHTLKVIAYDAAGHSFAATRTFVLDKTAPSISISSRGPNPFYPRKREGYKDNYIINFSTNEACTAYMDVLNSKGVTYRTVKKSIGAGTNSIAWDGKSNSGGMAAGTFSVRLRLVDSVGNSRSSSYGSATIKFYDVIVKGNKAIIIPR